jgi:translation initiation factor 1
LTVDAVRRSVSGNDPFDEIPDDPTSDLDRATQRLSVRVEQRTYDKPVPIVEGFDASSVALSEVASTLKKRLGAGGTVDDGAIEIQDDHRERGPDNLCEQGFDVE